MTAPIQVQALFAVKLVEGDKLLAVVRTKKEAERRAAFFARVLTPEATR